MRAMLTGLLAAVVFATLSSRADEPRGGIKALAGDWQAVEIEELGRPHKAEYVKRLNLRLTVNEADFLLTSSLQKSREGVAIDPDQKPKHLDLTLKTLEGNPVLADNGLPIRRLGVYELDGETLRIHLVSPGQDRPKDFRSDVRSGGMVITFKRAGK